MTRRRFFGYFVGTLGAVVLSVTCYLAFADLGRHKSRIEALVTRSIGRPFAIDGPFTLRLIPTVEVSAENVRLGNAQGGSQPQMIEFGKAVVQIGFWSLISGPPDVRLFELHDATVLLERDSDGRGNWVMSSAESADESVVNDEPEEDESVHEESPRLEVPVVIRRAQLINVRLIYREPKKHDRVVLLDALSIGSAERGMLMVAGKGRLDTYPMTLHGQWGPLQSLWSASDMRIDMRMSLGEMVLGTKGVVGSLNPLDGVDLSLDIAQPDVGTMLARLELPVVATGPLRIRAHLTDSGARTHIDLDAKAGDFVASTRGTFRTLSLVDADLSIKLEHADSAVLLQALELPAIATGPMQIHTHIQEGSKRRQLDLDAKLGDLSASVKGSLKTRSLAGSDLEIEATAADAARLAQAFGIRGVPAAPLTVSSHLLTSRKQFKFDPLTANIAGATATITGTLQRGDHRAEIHFDAAAEDLSRLEPTLPAVKASARGDLDLSRTRLEGKGLEVLLEENALAGSFLLTDSGRIEADVTSPRIDLSAFLSTRAEDKASATKPAVDAPKKKYLFGEAPFGLEKMKDIDAKVHVSAAELVFGERSLKAFDSNVGIENGRVQFDMRAAGVHEGTLQGAGTFVPASDGTGDLALKVDLSNVRASLASEGLAPEDVPPLGMALDIRIHGRSPREMASGANGYLVLTQGAGKMRSGLLNAMGGGVFGQLAQKLNPFSKSDPFMRLDCTIARADIVNGEVNVKPLVVQTEKVTITADGDIDLRTEKISIDFSTRPRKGIGVTPGMFTNPLIRLEGTLVSPKIGVGAKGLASGAVAAATGGVTVVAGGLLDRMQGEQDLCAKTLAAATAPAAR